MRPPHAQLTYSSSFSSFLAVARTRRAMFVQAWVGGPNATVSSKAALHPLLTGPWAGPFELPFAKEATLEAAAAIQQFKAKVG